MADVVTFKAEGVRGLQAALDLLPDAMGKRIRRKVIGRAGAAIAKHAKAFAPVDKGLFRQSLGQVTRFYPETDVVLSVVGSRRGEQYGGRANIAHLLESGWRIAVGGTLRRAGSTKAPRSRSSGSRGGGEVRGQHPGFQVMERALTVGAGEAESIVRQGIGEEVEKAAAELGIKYGGK